MEGEQYEEEEEEEEYSRLVRNEELFYDVPFLTPSGLVSGQVHRLCQQCRNPNWRDPCRSSEQGVWEMDI
jgi:hypothetical protein